MGETLAWYFWCGAALYGVAGLLFSIPFLGKWVNRLDPVAEAGTWGFRLAIVPGVVVLWPLLLSKFLRRRCYPPETEASAKASTLRRVHGRSWFFLTAVIPVIIAVALATRPSQAPSAPVSLQPAALPSTRTPIRSAELPLEVSVRTNRKEIQAQIDVSEPLAEPVVAAYWIPNPAASSLPHGAVFLGSIWGPQRLIFSLPPQSLRNPGAVLFLALTGEQRVLSVLPLQ